MKIVIAGGSGFIGKSIAKHAAAQGHQVVILSRSGPKKTSDSISFVQWDGSTLGNWSKELDGADQVINLAGHPISVPWSDTNKSLIVESRVQSTTVIADAIRTCHNPPKIWVNASAIGFYGNRGDEVLKEDSAPGKKGDFLVDTAVAWEEVFKQQNVGSTRKHIVRIGHVLGKDGGLFPVISNLAKWFLGGHHGSGKQYLSWVHVDDLSRIFLLPLTHELPEILLGCGPDPCTNHMFMASLRAMHGRPWSPPVPAFFLKLAEYMGAPDSSLMLYSQRAMATNLESKLTFRYPKLGDALRDLSKAR